MKFFRIIKLNKNVVISQLRISKYKVLELQLEFNIWDFVKFSVEFYTRPVSHTIFSFDLHLGFINILLSIWDKREWDHELDCLKHTT